MIREAEFLAARLDETEAAAQACADYDEGALQGCAEAPGVHLTTAQRLREVAAMRAIIGDEDDGAVLYAVHERGYWPEELSRFADQVLRLLAAIWDGHPDYDECR